MNTKTVTGTYGTGTPCNIFVLELINGLNWYCVDGSNNVNCTHETISDGCDVEVLHDLDVFTVNTPIDTENELKEAYLSQHLSI